MKKYRLSRGYGVFTEILFQQCGAWGGGIRENFVKISIIAKILDHRKRNVFLCLGHKEPEVRRYLSPFSRRDLFMKIPDVYLEIPIEALLCPWYQDILKKKY